MTQNESSKTPEPQRIDAGDAKGKSVRVVVVDANSLSLLATAGVLDSSGYICVCCKDTKAALQAFEMGPQDLVIWDVGNDADAALEGLARVRQVAGYATIPAVLIAEAKWSGLQAKTESLPTTRCLFQPIDPASLLSVVEALSWMPGLVDAHRRRGSRPSRPGWVSL